MNHRELTNILTRLAGIVIVVFAVVNIPVYFLQYYGMQVESVAAFVGITAAPFLLTIAIGLLLFFFPSVVTNRLVTNDERQAFQEEHYLLIAGFAVLGAYLVVIGVADVVYLGSLYGLAQEMVGTHFTPDRWADLTASLTEVALGVLLVLRGPTIIKLMHRIGGHSV